MRMALIFLFLSISASVQATFSCARAYGILLGKTNHYIGAPFAPRAFILRRKIMRRFSQLGGHRIHSIIKDNSIDNSDYLKGLANLAHALEDADPIWSRIKLSSIFITNNSRIFIHLDLFGLPTAHIPYDVAAHSFSSNLSKRFLEFGIERKLKKDWSFRIKNKGLTNVQYKNALEAFYNALEKGPVPEEMRKVSDVNIAKGGDVSSFRSDLTDEDIFQIGLTIPSHTVEDLEGIALGVLESEVGERLARNYAYFGRHRGIANAIVSDGVDRQTYREVLEKMIEKLIEGSIAIDAAKNLGPEDPDPLDLRNLARIHITKAGEVSTRQRGDGLFDLYLPADVILDDIPITINFSRLLLPAP